MQIVFCHFLTREISKPLKLPHDLHENQYSKNGWLFNATLEVYERMLS